MSKTQTEIAQTIELNKVDILTLQTIHRLNEEKGYCPTQREVAEATQLSIHTVRNSLENLSRYWLIYWPPREKRQLALTDNGIKELPKIIKGSVEEEAFSYTRKIKFDFDLFGA